jgi:hypothetical protein
MNGTGAPPRVTITTSCLQSKSSFASRTHTSRPLADTRRRSLSVSSASQPCKAQKQTHISSGRQTAAFHPQAAARPSRCTTCAPSPSARDSASEETGRRNGPRTMTCTQVGTLDVDMSAQLKLVVAKNSSPDPSTALFAASLVLPIRYQFSHAWCTCATPKTSGVIHTSRTFVLRSPFGFPSS